MNPDVAVDFSIWELFKNAHIVVQLVIVGLLAASVWSWAIIVEKFFLFAKTRKETDKFEQVFWSGQSLDELYQALAQRRNMGMAALFVAAMREWKRSTEREGGARPSRPMPGVQLRVEKVMDVTISREVERLERRFTFLATVGSTAPFIGLFGTVWGIMTSFQAIATTKNTSLAVVAPGIAEALFATALGLFAAIPAVIFYNKYNAEVARYAARLEGFADEFAAILSRQIDKSQ
jgi:biopolymer transport protein TolQ